MKNSFRKIFLLGLPAAILTAFAFEVGFFPYYPEYDIIRRLSLLIPEAWWDIPCQNIIFFIVAGSIFAAIFSLWAYFCLWDKNLIIILPILYISSVVATILISERSYRYFGGHTGPIPALFFIIIYWILSLLLAKLCAPKLKEKQ